ncbi:cell wall galactomannoprotein [Talaromyces proteolyticus]|uniref:Cell wall galactomannoprotein n=1 Tax=Talaromyces proteolyticus TaxID=1131652 RepID=A0AAD4KXN4_9EURO|nr:cell wall galactomannoprotein [Talaromyces proteolyticus]KAH8702160.1 cell wall galactomannoprotein [Talaromyces proteolyticus]
MRSQGLTLFLLGTLVAASPLARRDASTVLADLKTIGTNVGTLITAIKNFDGTLVGTVPITTDESTVEPDIKKAITDTTASSAFSAADSSSVTPYLLSLIPEIEQTTGDLVS